AGPFPVHDGSDEAVESGFLHHVGVERAIAGPQNLVLHGAVNGLHPVVVFGHDFEDEASALAVSRVLDLEFAGVGDEGRKIHDSPVGIGAGSAPTSAPLTASKRSGIRT